MQSLSRMELVYNMNGHINLLNWKIITSLVHIVLLCLTVLQRADAGTSSVVFYNAYPGVEQFSIHYVSFESQESCSFENLQSWQQAPKRSTPLLAYGESTSFQTDCAQMIFDVFQPGIQGGNNVTMEFKRLHVLDTDFVNLLGIVRENGNPSIQGKRGHPTWSAHSHQVLFFLWNNYNASCQMYTAAGQEWLEVSGSGPFDVSSGDGFYSQISCEEALERDPTDPASPGTCGYLPENVVRLKCGGGEVEEEGGQFEQADVVLSSAHHWCLDSTLLIVAAGIPGSLDYPLRLHVFPGDPTRCESSCGGLLALNHPECEATIQGSLAESAAAPTRSTVVFYNLITDGNAYYISYAPNDACDSRDDYISSTKLQSDALQYKDQVSFTTECTILRFQVMNAANGVPLEGLDSVYEARLVDSDYVNLIGFLNDNNGVFSFTAPRAISGPWAVHNDHVGFHLVNKLDSECEVVVGGSRGYVDSAVRLGLDDSSLVVPANQRFSYQFSCQEMLDTEGDSITVSACGYSTSLWVRARCGENNHTKYLEISTHDHMCLNSGLVVAIHGIVGDPFYPMEMSVFSGDPSPFDHCERACADIIYEETGCEEFNRNGVPPPGPDTPGPVDSEADESPSSAFSSKTVRGLGLDFLFVGFMYVLLSEVFQ